MQTTKIQSRLIILFVFVAMLYSVVLVLPTTAHGFFATSSVDINGYAWSSTIGWISLNCKSGGVGKTDICGSSNYKVTINTDGTVTGFAWSENVGWLQFGGLTDIPLPLAGTVQKNAELVDVGGGNYELQGWAKFVSGNGANAGIALAEDVLRLAVGLTPVGTMSATNSYDVDGSGDIKSRDALNVLKVAVGMSPDSGVSEPYVETLISEYISLNPSPQGGWDGWISLNGDSHSVKFTNTGPVLNSYAWGSNVVGWIDMFTDVTFDNTLASATLTVTGCTVGANESTCAGSVAWDFTNATNPKVVRTAPSSDTLLTSTNPSASGSQNPYTMKLGTNTFEARDDSGLLDTATVAIPNGFTPDGIIKCTANASQSGGVCNCDTGYIAVGGICQIDTVTPPPTSPNPTGALTIDPLIVRKGQAVDISWTTSDATTCELTNTQDATTFSGTPNSNGVETLSITLQNQVIITLTCDGTKVDQKTIRVLPSIFES